MSIKIEIDTKDEKQLLAIAKFFLELAGHQMELAPPEDTIGRGIGWRASDKTEGSSVEASLNRMASRLLDEKGETTLPYVPSKEADIEVKKAQGISPVEFASSNKNVIEKVGKKSRKSKKIEDMPGSESHPIVTEIPDPSHAPPFGYCAPPTNKFTDSISEPIQCPPTEAITFHSTISKITKLITDNKLTHAQVLEIIGKHGLTKTTELGKNDALLPAINVELEKFV